MWMRNTIALALMVATSAASAAPGDRARARRAREHPEFFHCAVRQSIAGFDFGVGATVYLDGRPTYYSALWFGGERPSRMNLQLFWGGEDYDAMAASASLRVTFIVRREIYGRFELRPVRNGVAAGPALNVGSRFSSRLQSGEAAWRDVDAAAHGEGLAAVVTDYDGSIAVEARIDPAIYDTAMRIIRESRAQIEAMLADYRNRCEPGRDEPVVVT
jgi:hypothetical protein